MAKCPHSHLSACFEGGRSVIQIVMSKKLGFGVWLCFAGLTVLVASPADQEKLASANTGFAFDLLKQITREQPGTNVFISPFSVSTVLQMVGNGAAGETKAEMQRVLKTAGLPAETLNAACKDLNQSLNSQTNVILNLANAIWYQEGFHLKPGFVSDNKNFFGETGRGGLRETRIGANHQRLGGHQHARENQTGRPMAVRSIDAGDSGQCHLFQGQVGPAV
jgi:serine protease inhibitor